MKKYLLAATAFVASVASTQAQFRPAGGEKNLEVMIAPLQGSPVSIGGIKLRKWGSATSAKRISVFLGYDNSSKVTQDEDSQTQAPELKTTNSSITVSLQPGFEKHKTGTERLSPYMGGYLDLSFGTTNKKEENQQPGNKVGYTQTKGSNLGVGLNAVAGFDYYLAKSLYLGTEIGFGVAAKLPMKKTVETVTFDPNGAQTTVSGDSKKDNENTIQLGPNVVGQLRLGWLF